MNTATWLAEAANELRSVGIETARLDALVLLEDVLGVNRASLLAHPETLISSAQLNQLNNYITQRKSHTPLAYIRGRAPFYGRNFYVSSDVLVPRPETETVIAFLLTAAASLPASATIADIGTGSGCIGITARLEIPTAQVILLDIDEKALAVARKNTLEHHTEVTIRHSNLLEGLFEPVDIVVANLPYVPETYPINQAASHEPRIALFSGTDGLDAYRAFWKQLGTLSHKPLHIIIEALPQQSQVLRDLAAAQNYKIAQADDFVQHFVLII